MEGRRRGRGPREEEDNLFLAGGSGMAEREKKKNRERGAGLEWAGGLGWPRLRAARELNGLGPLGERERRAGSAFLIFFD